MWITGCGNYDFRSNKSLQPTLAALGRLSSTDGPHYGRALASHEFQNRADDRSRAGALPLLMVIGVSVVAAIVATLLLAILNRFAQRPLWWFQIVAVVVLLLSFWGPLITLADAATKVALG
jgi:hypothetical protein